MFITRVIFVVSALKIIKNATANNFLHGLNALHKSISDVKSIFALKLSQKIILSCYLTLIFALLLY